MMLHLQQPALQACLFLSLGLLFSLIGSQTVVQAAEEKHPIDKTTEACQEKNDTTLGTHECLATAAKQWDQELNNHFNALMKKINRKGKEALTASQKQWLAYRDGEFRSIETIYGALEGTLWGIVAANAKVEIVKHRVLEFKAYLDSLTPEE